MFVAFSATPSYRAKDEREKSEDNTRRNVGPAVDFQRQKTSVVHRSRTQSRLGIYRYIYTGLGSRPKMPLALL